MISRSFSLYLLFILCLNPIGGFGQTPIRQISESTNAGAALIRVHADQRSSFPIPKFITGKFAEHLGHNIYNGMDAQILHNPTFAEYPFWNGQMDPDGVTKFQIDPTRIAEELRGEARRFGWPDAELNDLIRARADGLASFWARLGARDDVDVSPDTAPGGARAQRIATTAPGQGIGQWTWLPLHRQRQYEFELMARSPDLKSVTVSLWQAAGTKPVASAKLDGLGTGWRKLQGRLTVPSDTPTDASCKFTISTEEPGQMVLRYAFLRPSDHVNGADPEVVAFLREAHLPLLRWPGGNFVSTYHWEDAIGPVAQRPTKPNYAWGAIEPNTFGTDEFIALCRAVGCEPMICVNAGSGAAEEAARWIEYCNGPANSPMGRLRALYGHPEPYHVTHWEIGNELWGHWQMRWTTPIGYVDRFRQFSAAMLAADRSIQLYACGAPAMSDQHWNRALITAVGTGLPAITDHPLIGGGVPPSTEPLSVYRDFMAVPEVLQQKWAALRDSMSQNGVAQPKLAVTELQLFAHLGSETDTNAPVRLTRENFPGQASITEALYDILIYHAALRLSPFVELITHSATVNHGGGLRKERERVWANPCYYAQAAFAEFAEATPVLVEIEASMETAPMVLPDLRNATNHVSFSAVDVLAALAKDHSLLLSLVNRSSAPDPILLTIQLDGFNPSESMELRTLAALAPWSANSLEHPSAIHPIDSVVPVRDGKIELKIPPFTVMRGRIAARK